MNVKVLILILIIVLCGVFFYNESNKKVEVSYLAQIELIEKLASEYVISESFVLIEDGEFIFSLEDMRNDGFNFDKIIDPRCDKYFYESKTFIIVTFVNLEYSFEVKASSECDADYIEDIDNLNISLPVIELISTENKYEVDDVIWGSSKTFKITYDEISDFDCSYYYRSSIVEEWEEVNGNELVIELDSNGVIYTKTIIGTSVKEGEYLVSQIDNTIPSIDVNISKTTNTSIEVIVDSIDEETGIKYYYFSKDNGITWTSSQTSNTYVFSNLLSNNNYEIVVKVENNVGLEVVSDILSSSTSMTSQSPVISNVDISVTTDTISIDVEATDDIGISSYYYSYDNGITWTDGLDDNNYVFSNLVSGNTYYIKVKVVNEVGLSTVSKYYLTTTIGSPPTINDISVTVIDNSFIISVSASDLPNSDFTGINGYYYSIDDGITWTDAIDNNEYIYTELEYNTSYNIKIRITNRSGYEVISDTIVETTKELN